MNKLVVLVGLGLLAGCPNQARNDSIKNANEGTKALGAKNFDAAITAFKKATEGYHDNHLAWWGLGGAYAQRTEWGAAADAFSTAVQIEPDQPMYQMWYGVALYEKAVQDAREDLARKENKKPEEVKPDLGTVNFEKPQQHLQKAIELNKDMWRAHYYLGRIYREQDKPKDAAKELSDALVANPREAGPYIALGELYRRWDYTEEAKKVASEGVKNVPGQNELSDIWYVLGMAYDDKHQETEAIDAFSKAIEMKRDNHKAKFQRGQAYFRKGDFDAAKKDLEEFSKAGGASLEFAKQQATKMLMDIAAKKAAAEHPDQPKTGPTDPKKGGFQPPKK